MGVKIVAPDGMKWCKRCASFKPLDAFTGIKKKDGYCQPCKLAYNRELHDRLKGKPDPTLAARFWPKVNKDAPNGCWEWTANRLKFGYGCICYQGRKARAHRVVYEALGLPMPPADLVVDHMCRNRACVNPDHLRWVTNEVNSRENSASPFGKNAARTHCVNGHELAGDNLRIGTYFYMNKRTGQVTDRIRYTRICVTCYDNKPAKARERREARPL